MLNTFLPATDHWRALGSIAADSAEIETVCSIVARIMGVEPDGVGMLRVRGLTLEFVYPFELKSSGRIPLSSSAVAARTATTKKSELFNNFAKVTHNSVFELVPLGGSTKLGEDPHRIQKLMSAAVVDRGGKVLGVIQVSRKAPTREQSGPDFTESDLQTLEKITQHLAELFATL